MARFERVTPKHDYLNAVLSADYSCQTCLDTGRITETHEVRSYDPLPVYRETHAYCTCASGRAAWANDVSEEADFLRRHSDAITRADNLMGRPDHFDEFGGRGCAG